ncbi:MAG: preprotein translocase subunit SecG [Desulfatitalea sp.]|nr:preprotein translocase subunit SecG [Desulfatitalea sp.]NNK01061.1 preprotein translocase subunit SecG [Desulfatitalea sp.]
MSLLIIVIHVIVCLALILIVLLQTGKGADMGAAFGGGGSQTLFGTTGASTFLSKATTAAAIIFMLTSLTLAYMAGNRGDTSLVSEPAKEATQPATDMQSDPWPTAPDQNDTATPIDTTDEPSAAQPAAPATQENTPID